MSDDFSNDNDDGRARILVLAMMILNKKSKKGFVKTTNNDKLLEGSESLS